MDELSNGEKMVPNRLKMGLPLTVVLVLLGLHPKIQAQTIEINGDKVSVEAQKTPIQTLLKKLSVQYGITVRIDPAINPLVTASFKDRDLEEGLKAILRPHNHVLIWKSGPGKGNYVLTEIHVFKPGQKDQMVPIEETEMPPEPDDEPMEEDEREPQPLSETPVTIKNNKVYVPVILGFEGHETQTSLIFDTGAGSIVLHENVAGELGISESQANEGEGVGGIRIVTRTTHLNYVRVGPFTKRNLRVDIIDYQGEADENYNGLLGMNFIRGLKYTIDFDAQVIKWH